MLQTIVHSSGNGGEKKKIDEQNFIHVCKQEFGAKCVMYSHPVPAIEEYQRRLEDRERRVARNEAVHIRLGNARLLLACVAAGIAWASWRRHSLSPWWLVLPAIAFVLIAAYHSRILRARDLAQRAMSFYRNGLARIEDRWAGHGQTGDRFADLHHVYAADLDLFGRGGLFELLSTARIRMGEETLANWLLFPSPVEQIEERHAAIRELRDQLDLREDLFVLGEDSRVGLYSEALLRWAEAPWQMKPEWLQLVAPVLAIAMVAAVVIWWTLGTATPVLLIAVAEGIISYRLRHALQEVLRRSDEAFRDLDLLSGVLARMEHHKFLAPRLQRLVGELRSHEISASRAIAHLRTVIQFSDSRDNVLIRVLDVPLLYSVQVGFAAESWRRTHGAAVGRWLQVVGEIEALLSLATYSYEHPDDPFPEFIEGPACFEAADMGHPLVPGGICVRNTIRLIEGTRVFLVSGSNMSGKSTLLRMAGINTVLAMAGAPVRARRLRLTALQVGASIQVNDSLQEGSSRFYAEITRLRKILDLAAAEPPVLFLLDELLQGTNSNDRRIGAEGIVRALLKRGAIGLVTTHDLALADIGSVLDGQVHNVHFQEEFENGVMQFDYKLRDGVVTKSNGLALMRSIGLEV
jgi:hypothetical protein